MRTAPVARPNPADADSTTKEPMEEERVLYLSGEFIPESRAGLPITDAGVLYGHAVFEYTRTFNHGPFRLGEHLERLYASMRYAEIDCGLTLPEMERVTLETVERNRHLYDSGDDIGISHNVSNGPMAGFGPPPPSGFRPTVLVYTWPLSRRSPEIAEVYTNGVDVVVTSQRTVPARLIDPKSKNRSRIHYALADLEARRVDPKAWALLMDDDGFIAEGVGANFFIVRDGALISPEPRNILLGVTRAVVIELAAGLGIPFRETNIGQYEVIMADEAFFTTTPYVIVPVRAVSGREFGDGVPGPVTARLMEAFKELVGLDFVEQAERLRDAARQAGG
ncbi:MAG: aminotransferase class IV [Chloroflexi bacterium]|nr:aminotransferase class IV [Chloroflexota bacterium]MCY3938349.1 aminotransferase class IV [Chloroflexota bacterium]